MGPACPGEGEVRPELEQAWWGPEQKAGKRDLKGSSSPGFAGLVADSVSCMPILVPWGALTCTVLGNELKASAAALPEQSSGPCACSGPSPCSKPFPSNNPGSSRPPFPASLSLLFIPTPFYLPCPFQDSVSPFSVMIEKLLLPTLR